MLILTGIRLCPSPRKATVWVPVNTHRALLYLTLISSVCPPACAPPLGGRSAHSTVTCCRRGSGELSASIGTDLPPAQLGARTELPFWCHSKAAETEMSPRAPLGSGGLSGQQRSPPLDRSALRSPQPLGHGPAHRAALTYLGSWTEERMEGTAGGGRAPYRYSLEELPSGGRMG